MQKFTPKIMSPSSLGGAAASVCSRSDQVTPVSRQEEQRAHWWHQVWEVAEPPGMMGGGGNVF